MEILFNLLLTELAPVGYCLRVGGMQQEMGSMGGGARAWDLKMGVRRVKAECWGLNRGAGWEKAQDTAPGCSLQGFLLCPISECPGGGWKVGTEHGCGWFQWKGSGSVSQGEICEHQGVANVSAPGK